MFKGQKINMDENIPIAPPDHRMVPDPYGWEHVANDLGGWHPGLRAIAEDHLRRQGITPPSFTPEAALAESGQELPETQDAQAFVPSPRSEGYRTSRQERESGFAFSKEGIYKLLSDQRFQAKCTEAGVDPYDDESPEYWQVFAGFAHERADDMITKGGDRVTPETRFKLRALELTAATPAFVHAASEMYGEQWVEDRRRARSNLSTINNFHNLITEMAGQFPDMKASELKLGMLNSVNIAIADKKIRQSANLVIGSRIKAIQHEMAFGDILRHTGLTYRRATPTEDVNGGFDWLINEGLPTQMKLDVKASLREVDPSGASPISQKGFGKYAVYSLTSDQEFRDSFCISEQAAHDKAEKLLLYLGATHARTAAQSSSNGK